ncbi:MAG: trypsin-like peptidase domain-containing protein [Actinomycetia bacterium]|nr:trypsin-like peptidase domain-containing protein [Actinomycetes bacterium]
MAKKILRGFVFVFVLMLALGLSSALYAQDATDYEFTAKDKLILTQPSICYVTTMYYGYVYDPNFEDWSVEYMYGPLGGTGFGVNPDTGHIVTAAHVIQDDYVNIKWSILDAYIFDTYPDDYYDLTDADWNWIYDNYKVEGQNTPEPDHEVWVQFNTATAGLPDNPDTTYIRAEIIDYSPWDQRDIAILKIQPVTGRALSSVIIGDSSMVEIQDPLTIIGYPWNADISWESVMTPTVTSGMISARKMLEGTEVLQVDGTAAPGNSGGPVLNENGEVIGILTMGSSENINYLRPSNDVKDLLSRNGVENKLGMVDDNFDKGLAMYRQSHYSEAMKYFDAVLNSSQGHLQAQEYKANSQAAIDRGEDVPLAEETEPLAATEEEAEAVAEGESPVAEELAQEEEGAEAEAGPVGEEAAEGEDTGSVALGVTLIVLAIVIPLLIIIAVIIIVVVVLRKRKTPPAAAQPEPEVKKETKPAARFCPSCGKEVGQDQKFCDNCGQKIE